MWDRPPRSRRRPRRSRCRGRRRTRERAARSPPRPPASRPPCQRRDHRSLVVAGGADVSCPPVALSLSRSLVPRFARRDAYGLSARPFGHDYGHAHRHAARRYGPRIRLSGESPDCEGCPYRSQCLNLSEGTRYRVTGIRENAQTLDCAVHDAGVARSRSNPRPSPRTSCRSRRTPADACRSPARARTPNVRANGYCVPDGADFDDERVIDQVLGEPPHDVCALDRDLTLVEFRAEDG